MNKTLKRRLAAALALGPWSSRFVGPPKEAVWDVLDQDATVHVTVVEEPAEELLIAPDVLMGLTRDQLEKSLFSDPKTLAVARLRRGRYFQPAFAVVDDRDRLLYDYSQGWEFAARLNNYIFEEIRLPRLEKLPGRSLLLDVRSHSQNYFHWMMEGLAKIPAAQKAGYALDSFDHFLISHPSLPFHRDSLALAKIPVDRIVDTSEHPYLECEELIAVTDTREYPYRTHLDYVNSLGAAVERRGGERIFISRADAPTRKIENEEALSGLLDKYGFQRVSLTGCPVGEQAALFANAKAIIAPHGAGLTNLLFCKPRARLMELHFPTYTKGLYWRIASAMGMHYAALAGEPGVCDPANMIIPAAALEALIVKTCG